MGNVGVSSKHALALVHHGGGSSAELMALADRVRAAVRDRFGITLLAEPVLLGSGGRASIVATGATVSTVHTYEAAPPGFPAQSAARTPNACSPYARPRIAATPTMGG